MADSRRIAMLKALDRRTRRTIIQNLAFSLSVIAVLVTAALTIGIPLPLGVVGHEGSTIIVVPTACGYCGSRHNEVDCNRDCCVRMNRESIGRSPMDQRTVIRRRYGAGLLDRISDHAILILTTLMPLIVAAFAHAIRDRNIDSLVGWYAGSLLTYAMAWFVWRRTCSRETKALVILVVSLWIVYDAAPIFWIITDR
jgi:hypothetical protein